MFDYPLLSFGFPVLSTKVHAIWDYLAGPVLIGSPWLVGFATDQPAVWPVITAGGLMLVLAIVTDYEGGIMKQVLMIFHLMLDRLIGTLLGASPWLLGFADRIYWPHLSLGLLLLLMGLLTEWVPASKKGRISHESNLKMKRG